MGFHSHPAIQLLDIISSEEPSSVNKFGESLSVNQGIIEDIWDGGGTYPYPAINDADITHISQVVDQPDLRSATIFVRGLELVFGAWKYIDQTVQLDAADTTTLVALDTPLVRMYSSHVLSSFVPTQTINITDSAGATIYGIICAGNQKTLMTMMSTDTFHVGIITQWYYDVVKVSGLSPNVTIFELKKANKILDHAFEPIIKRPLGSVDSSSKGPHRFIPFVVIPAKHDIKITAFPDSKDAHVFAGFDMAVVPVDLFVSSASVG